MNEIETLEQVTREGRRRLQPGVTDPHCLVLRTRHAILKDCLAKLAANPPTVLDIGGRIQPYLPLCPMINLLDALLDYSSGSLNEQFAVNYSVFAQK
jgi:hypothetical protein